MNTIDKTPVSYKASDLAQMTIKTLIGLGTEAKKNNHRCKVSDVTSESFDPFELVTKHSSTLASALEKAPKSRKKKLVNRARALNYKYTIDKANTFLSFIKNKVLEDQTLPTYRFMISSKEQKIVDARIKYRTLQKECETARVIYINEKGGYYGGKKYAQKVETQETIS